MKCEFLITSKFSAGGTVLAKPEDRPCDLPAALYRCEGQISAIQMPLCEKHKNFVTTKYKWKLTTMEKLNEQSIQR